MSDTVRFLLGHESREIADVDPTMTVLEYLRTVARACGTKEGCAEGDCGACTVVIGEIAGQGIRYRAVNACILFLPVLDGRQLITVEHLTGPEGALHPAQQAMLDHHGSQCGFCTPGFVMALFALYEDGRRPAGRREVDDALAGNLCRCTGYRPIVDAAFGMFDQPESTRFLEREAETAQRLGELRRAETLALERGGHRYFAPRSVEALADLLARHPDAILLAGGTDVGLWVTKQHRDLHTVIHLGDVAELHGVSEGPEWLDLGAAVTHAEALAPLGRLYPDFGELLRRFASEQIRNSGTLGGNIANGSPIGDTMPALIALGARLVLRGADGRRDCAIEDFYHGYRETVLRPGEFVERIRVPLPQPGQAFRCYKVSKRFDQDISAVCGAFSLWLEAGRIVDARIGFGGIAAVPSRARRTEYALRGREWDEETLTAAEAALATEFTPLTDMRASEEYRRRVAVRLLRRCHVETTQPGIATRVLAEEVAT